MPLLSQARALRQPVLAAIAVGLFGVMSGYSAAAEARTDVALLWACCVVLLVGWVLGRSSSAAVRAAFAPASSPADVAQGAFLTPSYAAADADANAVAAGVAAHEARVRAKPLGAT